MSAALALAPAPGGFTVAEHAARVRMIAGQDACTIRQAAYDLRKLRGKQLIEKPGRTPPLSRSAGRRPHHRRPAHLARPRHRTDPRRRPQPPHGPQPKIWTAIDRDYEALRISMQALFRHVGIDSLPAAA
jgi:hypothetical protein